MSLAFLDTNALLKLFVPERGSAWLNNFVTIQQIVISEIALFESATVLRRRYIEGTFDQIQALALLRQIRRASTNYQIIQLGGRRQQDELINIIFGLPNSLRVRALDAIQLQAAVRAYNITVTLNPPEPFVFISSDRQLLQVAQAQGFSVENPEAYP
jgi:predicted nucleic acid-binding protein